MRSEPALNCRGTSGFSIPELAISLTIVFALAAVAIPTVMQSWNEYRLNSAATNLANLIEPTRYEAIRTNTVINCDGQAQGNTWIFWIDLNKNGNPDPTEPQVLLPNDIQIMNPGGGTPPGPSTTGFSGAQQPSGAIAFDSRGTVSYGAGASVVYITYLGFPNQPAYGYKAITVTPMGQTKIWSASASGSWHSP